ncbi:MAG: tail fiber domain-containing protein [Methylococcaceae bacterium]|nr:tail fiber domain-containing protein [Methylococcaceae bacterium]
MLNSSTGSQNTALGAWTLSVNAAAGNSNTALGFQALKNKASGSGNIAIGTNAGLSLTSGSSNIYIANAGAATESTTIRIGAPGHTRTFIGGIRGKTTGMTNAVPVFIDSNGQLGTVNSSELFKKDISDMNEASRNLLKLRPVTFRYKESYEDGNKSLEYGLIAEEVAKIYPDLVAYGADGKIETVQYQKLTPMMLNEIQTMNKQLQSAQAEAQKLEETIKQQAQEIIGLKEQALKLTALEQKVSFLQNQTETINVLTARLAKLEAHQMVGFNR